MMGPDLFRHCPDVAESDAERIVACTALGIVRPHLRVAERFGLLQIDSTRLFNCPAETVM